MEVPTEIAVQTIAVTAAAVTYLGKVALEVWRQRRGVDSDAGDSADRLARALRDVLREHAAEDRRAWERQAAALERLHDLQTEESVTLTRIEMRLEALGRRTNGHAGGM